MRVEPVYFEGPFQAPEAYRTVDQGEDPPMQVVFQQR